ncbi:hypothetical protein [Halomonas tibetensis]|uniref:Uncharacterized protein n=1 Tax=Halomonas tibetensis TaxID=2259590 RepID=A0ABV7B5U1_9GAMM
METAMGEGEQWPAAECPEWRAWQQEHEGALELVVEADLTPGSAPWVSH